MACTVCDIKLTVGTECYTSYTTFTCGSCSHEFAAPKDQTAQYRGLLYGQHVFRYYHSTYCPNCKSRLHTLNLDCDEFRFGDSPHTPLPVTPEEIEWLFSPERPRITLFIDS